MGLIFTALHAMLVTYILPPFADNGQCYSVHVTILVLREVAAVNVWCQTLMPLAKLIFWLQWMRHWAHAWAVQMYLSVGCSGCPHFSLSCSSCLSSFRWCYSYPQCWVRVFGVTWMQIADWCLASQRRMEVTRLQLDKKGRNHLVKAFISLKFSWPPIAWDAQMHGNNWKCRVWIEFQNDNAFLEWGLYGCAAMGTQWP